MRLQSYLWDIAHTRLGGTHHFSNQDKLYSRCGLWCMCCTLWCWSAWMFGQACVVLKSVLCLFVGDVKVRGVDTAICQPILSTHIEEEQSQYLTTPSPILNPAIGQAMWWDWTHIGSARHLLRASHHRQYETRHTTRGQWEIVRHIGKILEIVQM